MRIALRPAFPLGSQHSMALSMIQTITSPSNPTVKMLKSLHLKKGRADTGLFLGEGLRLATEAAEMGRWPEWLAVSSAGWQRAGVRTLIDAAVKRGVKVLETNEAILAAIAKRDNPQTVIGAWRQHFAALDDLAPPAHARGDALVIALDGVRDPGNLGTILRTADSIGATGVVLTGAPCDPFSVEAVRASMGSLFAVKLVKTSLEVLSTWRRAQGMIMVGTHLRGAQRHDETPIDRGVVVLMGTEQTGLDETAAAACDVLVKIPMRGRADSLNLAIATSVIAYDIWRRRGYTGATA